MKKQLLILILSLIFIQCSQVGGSDDNTGGPRPKPGAMPLEAQAAFQNGLMQLDSGDYRFAIWEFTQAIKHGPSGDHYWFSRGATRANVGDFEGALRDFSRAIQLDSTNAKYWADRGKLYSMLREDSNAISDLTKAIELAPSQVNYFLRRAVVKQDLGDDDGACRDAYIAVKLNYNREPLPEASPRHMDVEDYLNYDCEEEIYHCQQSWSGFTPYNPQQINHVAGPRGPGGPMRSKREGPNITGKTPSRPIK